VVLVFFPLLTGGEVLNAGSVVLLQAAFTSLIGRQPALAVVISTLAIAALFQPLRKRIQNGIDQRFYRRKVDTEQILADFRDNLRHNVDQDHLITSVLGVIEECFHPAHQSLWLRQVAPRGPGGQVTTPLASTAPPPGAHN
jgi:hypothetical protein